MSRDLRSAVTPARLRRRVLATVSVVLALTAALLLTVGLRAQQHAPSPSAAAGIFVPVTAAAPAPLTSTPSPRPGERYKPPPSLPPVPMTITVASIHMHAAAVINLGLNADRTVQVPPLKKVGEAGWYKYSPIPGDVGPAVILGHIDSAVAGRGVFFDLGKLRPGDTISIRRPDRRTARFIVNRVAGFPKTKFPVQQIYGYTPLPVLRLVTCGGSFDRSARSYVDNVVAFATLTSLE